MNSTRLLGDNSVFGLSSLLFIFSSFCAIQTSSAHVCALSNCFHVKIVSLGVFSWPLQFFSLARERDMLNEAIYRSVYGIADKTNRISKCEYGRRIAARYQALAVCHVQRSVWIGRVKGAGSNRYRYFSISSRIVRYWKLLAREFFFIAGSTSQKRLSMRSFFSSRFE